MRRSAGTLILASAAALATAVIACGGGQAKTGTDASAAPGVTYRGFGAGNWPGADVRAYAASSPFNQEIPAGTHALPGSETMIDQVLRFGPPGHLSAGVAQTADDWGHPTYYASSTDPIFTLHATKPYGRNPIDGMRIRIPDAAKPAGGGDGHMTVVEPDGWEYDFWQVQTKPAGGGTLNFSWGGRLRVDGDGLGTGGTASRFGNLAGMIRAQELAAGQINHALFVVLRCTGDGTAYGSGARRPSRHNSAFVYPAVAGGAPCAAGVPEPPMGARLRLAMTDAQIAALNLPQWKTAILTALAHYGGYVGDTGGDGIGFSFESSTMYTSLGYPDPLVALARSADLPSYAGRYGFDIGSGVDWQRYLQVIAAPKR